MILRIFFILLISVSSFGQIIIPGNEPDDEKQKTVELEKPKPQWIQQLHYGGNIWLGFAGAFYLDAAPMAGIDLTGKGTVVGLGATISYYGISKSLGGGLSAGPRIFARQKIWRTIFAHAEYELINSAPQNFYDSQIVPGQNINLKNRWGDTGYIGLGFYQNRMRAQSGAFISVLYNLGAPNRGYIPQQRIDPDGKFVFRVGFFI